MNLFAEVRLYLVIAIAALISWGLVQWNRKDDVVIKVAENSPDFFSSGYYKKQMDKEGLPRNQLLAEKMQHYPANGSTHLTKPIMTLYNSNDAAPWFIKAEAAEMAADGDNLELVGQTFINREARKNAAALTINTTDLHVKLSTHYADTKAWAEIISSPHKTSGTGMEVIFVSPIHLKLLSKVKGQYEFN